MKSLAGAMAFITGGASGIGLGLAQALAAEGAKVAVADARPDHLAASAQVAEREGWADRYLGLHLDVTDRPGFAAALDAAEAKLGQLRILINNAGVGIVGPVDEATHDDWDWGVGVNLIGVANGLVAGLPRIKAHGLGGHIVNTSSGAGLLPARKTRGIYAPTKAAIISLTEHLRVELEGENIGTSVVCPGAVHSNIAESEQLRPAHLAMDSGFRRALAETGAMGELPTPPPGAKGHIWLDPIDVGKMTVHAILEDKLYVITHPIYLESVKARHRAIEAAMAPGYLPMPPLPED